VKFVTDTGSRETDDFVIPAKAGIQPAAALDTGLRRCDDFLSFDLGDPAVTGAAWHD
jgi:hypothetical protein